MSNRQPKKDMPHVRDGMTKFEEITDRPILILDRDTRLSKPDASGRRNPYVVWLVDIGEELVFTYPNGNTDAVLRSWQASHPGETCRAVITPIPNAAGYMSYHWYDWTEEDTTNFMGAKENSTEIVNEDKVPF